VIRRLPRDENYENTQSRVSCSVHPRPVSKLQFCERRFCYLDRVYDEHTANAEHEESMLLSLLTIHYDAPLPRQRRVHYEESCRLDRPADNLRDIPVISRVPDALLSRMLPPTGDRQFGIALMPRACPIGKQTAGFVGWRALRLLFAPILRSS